MRSNMSPKDILKKNMEEFVEKGANLEHDRWARWQKYMFSKCIEKQEYWMKTILLTLPIELYKRWDRQIDTKYADLSEEEKESDRKETRNYLPLLKTSNHNLISSLIEELEGEKKEINHLDYGSTEEFQNGLAKIYGYNQAKDDTISKLKGLLDNK